MTMNDANNKNRSTASTKGGLFLTSVKSVYAFFVRAYMRYSIRSRLAGLSDHMLADIGISRGDIARIAAEVAQNGRAGQNVTGKGRTTCHADVINFPETRESTLVNDDHRIAA